MNYIIIIIIIIIIIVLDSYQAALLDGNDLVAKYCIYALRYITSHCCSTRYATLLKITRESLP